MSGAKKAILASDEFDWVDSATRPQLLRYTASRAYLQDRRPEIRLPKLLHYYAKTGSLLCYEGIIDLARAQLSQHGTLLFSLINTLNDYGETALFVAVKLGLHPVAKQLILWGADESLVPEGRALMVLAAERGDLSMMFLLYAELKRECFRQFHLKRQLKKMILDEAEETLMATLAMLRGRYSPYKRDWLQDFLGPYLCDLAIKAGKWRVLDTLLELKFRPSNTGVEVVRGLMDGRAVMLMYAMQRGLLSLFNLVLGQTHKLTDLVMAKALRQASSPQFSGPLEARSLELLASKKPSSPTRIKVPESLPPAGAVAFRRCSPWLESPMPDGEETPPIGGA